MILVYNNNDEGDHVRISKYTYIFVKGLKKCFWLKNVKNAMPWVIFLKKTLFDKLVTKNNAIDTSGHLLKSSYSTDKSGLWKKIDDADKKIADTSEVVKTSYNAEITEIEGKIPGITSLATTSTLNVVEKRYPTTVIWSRKQIMMQSKRHWD